LGKGGVGDSRCCQGYGSRKETEKERERKRKRRRKEGKVKVDGRKKVRERQRRGGGSNANRPDCNENAADRGESLAWERKESNRCQGRGRLRNENASEAFD
jgi:retron-type reverse transcriptase